MILHGFMLQIIFTMVFQVKQLNNLMLILKENSIYYEIDVDILSSDSDWMIKFVTSNDWWKFVPNK